jgi:drug/metabolite transporter (DMT)-like permease
MLTTRVPRPARPAVPAVWFIGVGIALGLGAALSWGLADYFAALASRNVGALRVVLGFHLVAILPLAVLAVVTDALSRVTSSQVALFALLGAVGWVGYLAFYGALAIGPISVLSPIVSGYAAVTVLLSVLIIGEPLSALQAVAAGATILGAMVASADVAAIARSRIAPRSALGFALALTAMALMGGFVFGVAYYRKQVGWLGPIFVTRSFTALFLLAHVLAAGGLGPVREPRKLATAVALLALLDTGGYVFLNLGVGHAGTAIVAAASAPYAVVPIIMGICLFHERPTPNQWVGVGLVIAGVIMLGAVG